MPAVFKELMRRCFIQVTMEHDVGDDEKIAAEKLWEIEPRRGVRPGGRNETAETESVENALF